MARTKAAFTGGNRLSDYLGLGVVARVFPRDTVNATSYDQNQRVEKKRKLYIVPRAYPVENAAVVVPLPRLHSSHGIAVASRH